METIISNSRSINIHPVFEREHERKYSRHLTQIQKINSQKIMILEQFKQSQKTTQNFYKLKEKARTFRESQQKLERKRENRLLLDKIWNTGSTIRSHQSMGHRHSQTGSNWLENKRRAEAIKQQNKKMIASILSNKVDVPQYKKKLESEIKDYLELRQNISKFKQQSASRRKVRSLSEKKIVLRLKDTEKQRSSNSGGLNQQEASPKKQSLPASNQDQANNKMQDQGIRQQIGETRFNKIDKDA